MTTGTSHAAGGTLRFQAPELINPDNFLADDGLPDSRYCKGDPTTKSDVYALAMTVFEVRTIEPLLAVALSYTHVR